MPVEELRRSPMMSHLLDALERGEDIGHYGRLVFAMVGRHFMSEDELCALLARNVPEHEAHDYNPPRRERILEWQSQQAFPICPDPNECNVYRDLKFPERVYKHIEEF